MRASCRALLTAALSWIVLPCGAQSPEAATPPVYESQNLGEGIYLLRPREPSPWRNNTLVVEGERGLLVVDAQPCQSSARDVLRAIELVSTKPIRYLVLTHAHAAALGGADAFPADAVRIMSRRARERLHASEFDPGAEVAARDPEGWQASSFEPPRVDLAVSGPTEIFDGKRIVISPLPAAHSSGDLIVALPEAKVVAVGHLVFPDRNPYARDATLGGWVATVNHVLASGFETFVPLEGPPLDGLAMRRLRDALAWLRGEISLAFRDLVPRARVAQWIREREAFPQHFDPGANPSFLDDLVARGVEEEIIARRKRGLPIPD